MPKIGTIERNSYNLSIFHLINLCQNLIWFWADFFYCNIKYKNSIEIYNADKGKLIMEAL